MENNDVRFYKFVEFVGSNKLKVFVAFLCLLVIGVGWTLFEQRSNIFNMVQSFAAEKQVSDQQFRTMVHVNGLIQSRLDVLRIAAGAERVAVRRFHNSKHDLTTVPFERITAVFSSDAPSFQADLTEDRSLPLSTRTHILQKMWGGNASNPICFQAATDDIPKGDYQNFLIHYKFKYVTVCPITNIAKYPLGLIAVYNASIPTSEKQKQILDAASETAEKVGGYMDLGAEVKDGAVVE